MNNYGDKRQLQTCVYCGKPTRTRDHVPSKVLLDEPYPDNLAVVPSCIECNHGFSSDEEYFACLIEVLRLGSFNPEKLERNKVKRILSRKPSLLAELLESSSIADGKINMQPEWRKVENVVLKHAKGLAAYALNLPIRQSPIRSTFIPYTNLSEEEIIAFNQPAIVTKVPETGSRMSQQIVIIGGIPIIPWIEVQANRFRYLTSANDSLIIRMVFNEYLMCELIWHDEDI